MLLLQIVNEFENLKKSTSMALERVHRFISLNYLSGGQLVWFKMGTKLMYVIDAWVECLLTYSYIESNFRRLKLIPASPESSEPCFKIAYDLTKKLEDMMRHRTMPRKYAVTAKGTHEILKLHF